MGLNGFSAFSITSIGSSHIKHGRPCEDSSRHLSASGHSVIAVADGHGGEAYFRSGIGSMFASSIAVNILHRFVTENHGLVRKGDLRKLSAWILSRWHAECARHFEENPLSPAECDICMKRGIDPDAHSPEFYGTTLIYACITEQCAFISQLGDGKCLLFGPNGKTAFPIRDDPRLGFGVTTSMCGMHAVDDFRHFHVGARSVEICGTLLCTDGVSDSYADSSLKSFGNKIFEEFRKDRDHAMMQLEQWLPELSRKGRG